MLSLILILLVVFVVLSLLLAAWTMFFQGYIYSEPVEAIYWRAPAAAAALTLFLCIWVVCDYRSIAKRSDEGRYQNLFDYSASETETYEYLRIPRENNKELDLYTRQGNQYVRKDGRLLRTRPSKIIASHEDKGEQHVFEPKRDAKKNFQLESDQSLRYYEEGNEKRFMVDTNPGQVSIDHFGWRVVTWLLNFGFLLVWFLSLWLLLRFQWSHALGLAFGFWLVSLFILPMILTQAEKVRKERLAPVQTTQTARCFPQTAILSHRSARNGYRPEGCNGAIGVVTITNRFS